MPAKKIDVEIIILNYNTEFWLKKTLSSLDEHYRSQTKLNVQVTVVDNNSSDGSVAMVKQEFKWTELIELEENGGFAKANNVALRKSKAKYVMLLNSDVELTNHSNFDELVQYLDEHSDAAVITPRVQFVSGEIDPAAHRGEPTLWASFTYFAGLEKLFPETQLFGEYHQGYKDMSTIHEVDACSGAAMIVRASTMHDDVGYLDEQFFMYAEDLDWCRRFRESGMKVVFYPHVSVIHHKYKSGLKNSSQKIASKTKGYFYDTMLQYYDKYYRYKYPQFVRSVIKYLLLFKKGV